MEGTDEATELLQPAQSLHLLLPVVLNISLVVVYASNVLYQILYSKLQKKYL